ncbi:hypothetical protein Q5741_18575 [Paenibacillus sp. JX-17]|uniref:WYL domain-containing protein n=1 Tax=Paenibacillus lacisoli TaxID=3064525 RepID=A0ABT9CII4_9BACL|nr:hypothetical protein [Paenibacillus sp. JX-17]MDO7908409.1 hypothetical protein [Paenibacillus sp. JX-17]
MPVKYVGEIVEIVYLDQAGNITQRKIEVHSVRNGLVKAECLQTRAPRTFRQDNILAWKHIRKGA